MIAVTTRLVEEQIDKMLSRICWKSNSTGSRSKAESYPQQESGRAKISEMREEQ